MTREREDARLAAHETSVENEAFTSRTTTMIAPRSVEHRQGHRARSASDVDDPLGENRVVVPETRETTTTTTLHHRRIARARIRRVDMAEVLSRPEEPLRWVIDQFVQRGTLTVLAARGGTGKSWLGIAACVAVQSGRPLAGMGVEQGAAVYADGEMGERMMASNFRKAGLPHEAFTYLDTLGLDLGSEEGCAELQEALAAETPALVVLDSLRRLTPGKRENDSDDMAPVLGRLAVMAREINAAILLLHHSGWSEERAYRGSSAIGDQADAVFSLERRGADTLRLSCNPERGGKMRGAQEPRDRYLQLDIDSKEGVVVVVAPLGAETTTRLGRQSAEERAKQDIVAVLRESTQPVSRAEVARASQWNDDNKSFRSAWKALREDECIVGTTQDGWSLAEDAPHPTAVTPHRSEQLDIEGAA